MRKFSMFDAKSDIDWSRVQPLGRIHFQDPTDEQAVTRLAEAAQSYLERFGWCKRLSATWHGDSILPHVAVFLVEVEPTESADEQRWMWVVVGDLPPAHISPLYARNPCQALNSYCGEMQAWVDAVKSGGSTDGLIPVNVPPTFEHAAMLESRLKAIFDLLIAPQERLLAAPVAADRDRSERSDGSAMERTSLREVVASDLPIFFAHEQDAEARRMAAFTSEDPSDRAAFEAHWAKILAKDTVVVRTVVVRDQAGAEQVAGHIASFMRGEKREVTYWIGREFWGRGVATRALKLLIDEVKERPIYGRAAADNAPSIRVLQKCGFVEDRRERGFASARGEEIEEVVMRLA